MELFYGWYLKQENRNEAVSVVISKYKKSGKIQVITKDKVYLFETKVSKGVFNKKRLVLHLENGRDVINIRLKFSKYKTFSGCGRLLCCILPHRHEVLSMQHRADGIIKINDKIYEFSKSNGYMERFGGYSPTKGMFWSHSFLKNYSVMAVVQTMGVAGGQLHTCKAYIMGREKNYRICTCLGARIISYTKSRIILKQRKLLLIITILDNNKIHYELMDNKRMVIDEVCQKGSVFVKHL